ncbi:diguanylate cyclase domain-containing protein [Stenotrophomonas rhizophila]|jgi:diguanylate cyclase (GGDEF)-like protein|uniref:diguanylate cyclase n=1 Tax=Stenotrophomonas nematodicola TaxID=2656746 RepID=A0ABW7CWB4_9GAMM|nr:GGDEF domain-containing protein [Stenotrophomonas sp. BIGb0135]MCS4235193.1 diguanylate cyclase (GGDEF)-like protein [Stenotrophomonas sp. BIGb0135]
MTGKVAAIVCEQEPGIAQTAMAEIVHAVLSSSEFALFAQFGRQQHLAKGDQLFHRGQAGDTMYVVVSGGIELDFGEDLLVKSLGPNEFFGELGLLIGDHPRSAEARAITDSVVLELGNADFQRLVDHDPGLIAYFLRRTIMRVVSNEQVLIRQLRRRNHDLETALDNLYITTHQLTHTRELVRTDELTGLHNRRGLALYLQDCRTQPEGPPQGLLLIDCDHFKKVNDEHGHQAGDRVLQSMANILRSVATETDLACRLGGDEFCLLLRTATADSLQHAAEFILSAVHGLMDRAHGVPHVCPVSIGVRLLEPHTDWSEWYARADNALYQAKRLGGNRLHWSRAATATP